jgi:tetratricopeptide (TPR) repeat protein
MTKKPAKKAPAKKQSAKKAPMSPQALAQEMLRLVTQHLGPDELIMPEDVNALIGSLSGPSPYDRLSDAEADAKEEAQQIAFDAMEAGSEAQARKLAKRALKLDPDCVDALLVMVDLDARSPRETIEGLQKAVAAGERSLGDQFIRENTGHFWMLIETRPYMRALQSLADAYRSQGISLDAIRIYEKMLKLNPNDNQGVRDPLLGLYLETRDLNGAASLFKKYKDDASANFAWARVLERFLAGDREGAGAALAKARKANPHMELYLTVRKPLPEEPPEMYSPGSEQEAVLSLGYLSGAWAEHKDAALWLFDRLAEANVRAVPGKAVRKKLPAAGKSVQ